MLKEDFISSMRNDLSKYDGFSKHKDYNSFFQNVAAAFDTAEHYNNLKSDFEKKNFEILYTPAKKLLDDADATAKKMADEVLKEEIQEEQIRQELQVEAEKVYLKSGIDKKAKSLLLAINKYEDELKTIKLKRCNYQAMDRYFHSYAKRIFHSTIDKRDLKILLEKDAILSPTVETR